MGEMAKKLSSGIEVWVFEWSRDHGNCADCSCPAAFYSLNAYGEGRHQRLCAVCAANAAAEGMSIKRIDGHPECHECGEEPHQAHLLAWQVGDKWIPICSNRALSWWGDGRTRDREMREAGAPTRWLKPLPKEEA